MTLLRESVHDRRAQLFAWISADDAHGGLTAREIAEQTGMDGRTLRHDLTALAASRALVRTPGRPARWHLLEGAPARARSLPPRTFEQMREVFPTIRQSYLSRLDDCSLALLFDLEGADYSSHPQARGTLFHRFTAEALRTMQREGERRIPVGEALEILYEVLLQRDVPESERVRIPMRELPLLRIGVIKWAGENEFNVDRIAAIERRLSASLNYVAPTGELIERTLTGQVDLLVMNPPDGATVVDWKMTWALPAEPTGDPDPTRHLSYEGYFQQRFYGWLVMRSFPAVQSVTLREVYPLVSGLRKATLLRSDLEDVERELAILAAEFDARVQAGGESPLWSPSPGKHCSYCPRPGDCPIEAEARGEGAIEDGDMAKRYAAQFVVADQVRKHRVKALKAWVDRSGEAVPLKSAKGRYVMGWKETANGRRFVPFVPEDSDRGPDREEPDLAAALRASADQAEAQTVQGDAKVRRRVA